MQEASIREDVLTSLLKPGSVYLVAERNYPRRIYLRVNVSVS